MIKLGAIWVKFALNIKIGANLALRFKKMYAETSPSNVAIWDEFRVSSISTTAFKNTIFNI